MKKIYIVAFLIFGMVMSASAVVNASEKMNGKHGDDCGQFKDMPKDSTMQERHDAVWEQKLADLGLTEDSTIGELMDAMKAKKEACMENPEECPKNHRPFGRGRR